MNIAKFKKGDFVISNQYNKRKIIIKILDIILDKYTIKVIEDTACKLYLGKVDFVDIFVIDGCYSPYKTSNHPLTNIFK